MAGDQALKVLMIDSERTWRGGEAQLWLLMRGLLGDGYTLALAAPGDSEIAKLAAEMSVDVHPMALSGSADVGSAWRLRGVIRRGEFDIVHAHSSHGHGVMSLACAGVRPRPNTVVSRRVDFAVGTNPLSAIKYRHGADQYLAISRGVREVLERGGIAPDRIDLVPSGIDLAKFDGLGDGSAIRREFGVTAGEKIVGNVAALAPHKSQVDFVRAAALLCERRDDMRFFIVGEGELRTPIEKQIAALGLANRIHLTGFREDVLELLKGFDCFVLSSYLEGLCTSIMDAHALGVPVVATDTGGVPDLVVHAETGLLCPVRDPEELAAGVERLLGDETLRRRCVRGGLEKSKGYDYRNMVYKTKAAYERLIGGNEDESENMRSIDT